jgi:hypothetical protein
VTAARQPGSAPFVIHTRSADSTIVGTAFEISVAAGGTELKVSEGRVRFGNNAGAVQVDGGHASRCATGSMPSLPVHMDLGKIAIWRHKQPGENAPPAPAKLGISGGMFTLNGKPTFLLGVSYFDGRSWRASDLDDLKARRFNLIRIMLDLPGHGFFDAGGNLVHRQTLVDLSRACAERGIVVDATILGSSSFDGDFARRQIAARNAVAALGDEPNVFFHVVSENDGTTAISRHELGELISDIRARYPAVIVAASGIVGHLADDSGVNAANIEDVIRSGVMVLSPLFKRTDDWYDRTHQRVSAVRNHLASVGRDIPVYLQEENRRGDGDGGGDLPKDQFIHAAVSAVNAGAAGWVFHTRAGFFPALENASFFSNLDSEELAAINSLGDAVFGPLP